MTLLSIINFDELLKSIVIMLLTVLLIGLLLKKLNQPYFVAYIIAGILLGPYCIKVFSNADTIAVIGELGLLIQMFFIGTKMEIQTLAKNIKKPIIGVAAQLFLSFLFIFLLGFDQDWSWKEVVLFSFIISLSSSAIILEYLEKNNEIKTSLGTLTSGILILQDFQLVPMILVINFFGQKNFNLTQIILLVSSTIAITLFLKFAFSNRSINFHFPDKLKNDHEAQVFVGLLLCFGFGLLTQIVHLSAAIGALIGGLLISKSTSMQWLDTNLIPFRVFFLSLFFLSIGLQINVEFLTHHIGLIFLIVGIILLVNSVINAIIFRLLNESWQSSIYAGALLSQIGEFSLVLCLAAKAQNLVSDFWYQLTLTVISATMLMTAIWINIIRTFIYKRPSHIRNIGEFIHRNIKKLSKSAN
jgi:CPA2 family monovalent cation:H+ antiporter-2